MKEDKVKEWKIRGNEGTRRVKERMIKAKEGMIKTKKR
jgi:hypothetical protein